MAAKEDSIAAKSVVRRVYKYRLYPTRAQEEALAEQLYFCCDLYNSTLELRRDSWKRDLSLSHGEISKQLTDLVRTEPGLVPVGMSRSMLQKAIERNNRAFQAFFRRVKRGEKPGYPRFRSVRRYDTLASQYGRNVELRDDPASRRNAILHWGGVGEIKLRQHRPLPEGSRVTEVQIQRSASGWHACVGFEMPAPEPLAPTGSSVGLDLGITTFAALSTGELISGPRPERVQARRVARLHRELARKKNKRSKRRAKAVARLARAKAREVRVRLDHEHKLARRLVNENDLICIENLSMKGLASGMLARDVHDQAWGRFGITLAYKAAEAGRELELVDPRSTSQECSGCGHLPETRKTLHDRVHSCEQCGLVLDRDVNAARNILRRGERQRETSAVLGLTSPADRKRVISKTS